MNQALLFADPPTNPGGHEPIEDAMKILFYLNLKANRQFRATSSTTRHIRARLKQTPDIPGIKRMIDRQVMMWKHDDKMSQYLNPETLFRPLNFERYYEARNRPAPGELDRIKARIDKHPANKPSVYGVANPDAKQIEEYRHLKQVWKDLSNEQARP